VREPLPGGPEDSGCNFEGSCSAEVVSPWFLARPPRPPSVAPILVDARAAPSLTKADRQGGGGLVAVGIAKRKKRRGFSELSGGGKPRRSIEKRVRKYHGQNPQETANQEQDQGEEDGANRA